MATKKNVPEKQYVIEVVSNPDFCGKGAGGVQFANGKATTDNARMAEWFKKHKGYKVTEAAEKTGE